VLRFKSLSSSVPKRPRVSSGAPTLVMELVDGPALQERLARGPLPPEEALSIARRLAEALEYAHERGIVHRDLKPANVKLRTDGTVKVLDFGLARALDVDAQAATSDFTRCGRREDRCHAMVSEPDSRS